MSSRSVAVELRDATGAVTSTMTATDRAQAEAFAREQRKRGVSAVVVERHAEPHAPKVEIPDGPLGDVLRRLPGVGKRIPLDKLTPADIRGGTLRESPAGRWVHARDDTQARKILARVEAPVWVDSELRVVATQRVLPKGQELQWLLALGNRIKLALDPHARLVALVAPGGLPRGGGDGDGSGAGGPDPGREGPA